MPALFAAMFAALAGLLALGPVLPAVAREFEVSVAAAGQLRTLGGLAGGVAAVAVALLSRVATGARPPWGARGDRPVRYLVGAAVGGAALVAGGYELLAVSPAALFALGTVQHLTAIAAQAGRPKGSSVFAPLSLDPDAA